MNSREQAQSVLQQMADPKRSGSLMEAGRISGLTVREGSMVGLVLAVDDLTRSEAQALESAISARLREAGFASARIIQTSEREAAPTGDAGAIPGVRHVIGVGAGKGGVGKSTVAAGLALALKRRGLAVGLLDGDIQGPSLHILLGVREKARATADKRLLPADVHGLKLLGMGLMADPDKAVAWRGPMVAGALVQMATVADWGPLDILVVDLPPGTGDVHLALAQKLKPAGALVVSTPQALATADARRAVAFFDQLQVPVFGAVMNMAAMAGPDGSILYPFGRAEHAELGAEIIGELPLDPALAAAPDAAQKLAEGVLAGALDKIAAGIAKQLRI